MKRFISVLLSGLLFFISGILLYFLLLSDVIHDVKTLSITLYQVGVFIFSLYNIFKQRNIFLLTGLLLLEVPFVGFVVAILVKTL